MGTEPKQVKLPTQLLRNGGKDAAGICFRCGKPVALDKAAVLEQDSRIYEWHDLGMPPDASWGPALFGDVCAKHMRRRARLELEGQPESGVSRKEYLEGMSTWLMKSLEQRSELQSLDEHNKFMLKVVNHQLAELNKPK